MSEIVFSEIVQAVCRHFGIVCDYAKQKICIEQIGLRDSNLVYLLTDWQQAQSTARFLLSDFELCHKMPDIWKAHCEQSQATLDAARAKLVSYCLENKIATREIMQL